MKIYKIAYVARDKEWSDRVEQNKMTEDEFRERLKHAPFISSDGVMSGIYKNLGWVYDIRDELKRYWVSTPFGDIKEYYAEDLEELEDGLRHWYQGDDDYDEPLDDYEIVEVPNPHMTRRLAEEGAKK